MNMRYGRALAALASIFATVFVLTGDVQAAAYVSGLAVLVVPALVALVGGFRSAGGAGR